MIGCCSLVSLFWNEKNKQLHRNGPYNGAKECVFVSIWVYLNTIMSELASDLSNNPPPQKKNSYKTPDRVVKGYDKINLAFFFYLIGHGWRQYTAHLWKILHFSFPLHVFMCLTCCLYFMPFHFITSHIMACIDMCTSNLYLVCLNHILQ